MSSKKYGSTAEWGVLINLDSAKYVRAMKKEIEKDAMDLIYAGERVIADPDIPENLKSLVRQEVENHVNLMNVLGLKCQSET